MDSPMGTQHIMTIYGSRRKANSKNGLVYNRGSKSPSNRVAKTRLMHHYQIRTADSHFRQTHQQYDPRSNQRVGGDCHIRVSWSRRPYNPHGKGCHSRHAETKAERTWHKLPPCSLILLEYGHVCGADGKEACDEYCTYGDINPARRDAAEHGRPHAHRAR